MAAKTIQELQASVNQYAEDCSDHLVDQRNLTFGPNKTVDVPADPDLFHGDRIVSRFTMNDWSFRQMAGRLDAPPVSWLGHDDHCPDELRRDILNELVVVRDPEQRLLVRARGTVARAVLSDEYVPFDNKPLIEMVAQAVETLGTRVEIHRPEVGDDLRVYILLPAIAFPNSFGTPSQGNGGLHPAIYLRNSERGGGKVRIHGAVYREVCSNGVIYGWNTEEQFNIAHRFIAIKAMTFLVAEGIATALKMSEQAAQMFMASHQFSLRESSLKGLVDSWIGKYGIGIAAGEDWLQAITGQATEYGRTQDPRVFDAVNGATLVAHNLEPIEREQMERMAGDLLAHYVPVLQEAE